MKKSLFILNLILTLHYSSFINNYSYSQNIPYNATPDWESTPANHIATGLGLGDINGDGWKDLVVANGNDIYRQHLVVYYNNGGGNFPLLPDWESDDIDYHGHLSLGDVDGDGDLDVAVSVYLGPSGFGDPGKVKVYYNQGNELEGMPSFIAEDIYTFSCALGDADGDGDLDLAVACGEPYGKIFDNGRVFINEDGIFSEDNVWLTDITMGPLDVDFGDFDMNGFLDLAFGCEYTPNYIYLADDQGNISTTPAWESSETENFINSIDIGFIGDIQYPVLVMTGNDQLGGDGRIRLYQFETGIPPTSLASWTSNPVGYGSGILLSDVTNNDTMDLVYGGWWLPMEILVGDGIHFNTTPAYTANVSSVVEAILTADLGKENIGMAKDTVLADKLSNAFYLTRQNIEGILQISLNGVALNYSEYSHIPGKNWFVLKNKANPGDLLIVDYEYTIDGDLVISNWDSQKGNYIYYNTNTPIYLAEENKKENVQNIVISPQPSNGEVSISFRMGHSDRITIDIIDITGKIQDEIYTGYLQDGEHRKIIRLDLADGIYFLRITSAAGIAIEKVIIQE